jgi:hypothetical protein
MWDILIITHQIIQYHNGYFHAHVSHKDANVTPDYAQISYAYKVPLILETYLLA